MLGFSQPSFLARMACTECRAAPRARRTRWVFCWVFSSEWPMRCVASPVPPGSPGRRPRRAVPSNPARDCWNRKLAKQLSVVWPSSASARTETVFAAGWPVKRPMGAPPRRKRGQPGLRAVLSRFRAPRLKRKIRLNNVNYSNRIFPARGQ